MRATQWERTSAAVDAALQCIYQMAIDPTLQAAPPRLTLMHMYP